MIKKVWLDGQAVALDALAVLGQGGEADVYDLGDGRALKVFKTPDHPDVAGLPALEAAAAARLAEHEDKLRAFPATLPRFVVKPQALATRLKHREVVGYAMPRVTGEPLMRFAEPHWRRAHPTDANTIVAALRHLHDTVAAVHRAGVVIGDFNDTNVLVAGPGAEAPISNDSPHAGAAGAACHLIDADSWQFGRWRAQMFTERFVDPRLCLPEASAPALACPHDADGDWFAFAVMVFRSLLLIGPYGGVLAPARKIPHAARPLHRISVFDADVVYPKAAIPPSVLPDDLVDHLRHVFERDRRGAFPVALLDRLRFQRCACGAEHARASCPVCRTSVAVPAAVVRGRVRASRLDPAALTPSSFAVGRSPAAPVFLSGGALYRNSALGPEAIGQVLAGQTRAWCGSKLGVGLYRAGGYTVTFVFRPDRRGLIDGVALPRIRGALLDVHAVCGADRAWLWWREALAGKETVRCAAIAATGEVLGVAEAPADDAGWLAGVPGACAVGALLFVPADDGVLRVEAQHGALAITRTYPDTADFVTAADQLHPGPGGLDVQTRDGALRLTLT